MKRFILTLAFISGLVNPALAVEIKEVVSDSGITSWLVEEHALPLIAVRVAFTGSGFAYDREGGEGRANMAAAMLTTGAGDMDEREFNRALEERAIEFNTFVNEDMLEASMQSLSEHKEEAFSYLALALAKPRFDSDAVERTRRQMFSILKQAEQTPGYLLERAWSKQAFGTHPYSRPQLGTKNSINRLDRYDMEAYTERYLTRENMLVAVVGDITPEALKALLDKHFAELPKKYRPDSEVAEFQISAGGPPAVVEYGIPQTLAAFGLQGLKRDDPDYITAYVMNQILGGDGSMTALLNQELREKRGLTYGAYSQLTPLKHGARWGGGFSTRNDQAFEAVSVLRATVMAFAKMGPTDKELADAKNYLTGSFVTNLDSNADLAAFLINMQYNRLGLDYLDKRNAMVQAVSKDGIMAMATRLLDPDKLIIVMVGSPAVQPPASAPASPPPPAPENAVSP